MTTGDIMRRVVVYGAVVVAVVAVLGGIIGILVSGLPGLLSAMLGTALAGLFLGLSAIVISIALRVSRGQLLSTGFFGVVLGGWLVKFLLFLLLVFAVGQISWLDPRVAFGAIVAAVVGSLIVDVVVILGARQPLLDRPDLPDEDTLGGPARRPPTGRGGAGS